MNSYLRALAAIALLAGSGAASARNIVISNDDGLTANVKALYDALKAQGHDVIVSVPCANQSGMGAAIKVMKPLGPLAADCRNGAAKAGSPGAGPVTREGFGKDFFYVDGTPVMATLYGIDIPGMARWGRAPDLVLSGPNEGQNVGQIVLTSGTVSNAQYAAGRGIPSIALSAPIDTDGGMQLANPKSSAVAKLVAQFVKDLDARSGGKALLPAGVALNVNFPNAFEGAKWKLTRIGDYLAYRVKFSDDAGNAGASGRPKLPGLIIEPNRDAATPAQKSDEAEVYKKDITVSVMQVGYDSAAGHRQIAKSLRGLVSP